MFYHDYYIYIYLFLNINLYNYTIYLFTYVIQIKYKIIYSNYKTAGMLFWFDSLFKRFLLYD